MDCREANRALHEYVDGELSPEARARLLEHVNDCPRCKAKLESIQAVTAGLHGLEMLVPRPGFTQGVLERLRLEKASEHRLKELVAQRHQEFGFLTAFLIWAKGAAVMAVVVLAFGMLNLFVPVKRPAAWVLSTDPTARIAVAGREVTVPQGTIVKGNLTIVDGNVTLGGRVEGDVRVVRGSVKKLPGANVAGRVVVIESPVAQARDAVMGAMDWFVSFYRQMTNRMIGR